MFRVKIYDNDIPHHREIKFPEKTSIEGEIGHHAKVEFLDDCILNGNIEHHAKISAKNASIRGNIEHDSEISVKNKLYLNCDSIENNVQMKCSTYTLENKNMSIGHNVTINGKLLPSTKLTKRCLVGTQGDLVVEKLISFLLCF